MQFENNEDRKWDLIFKQLSEGLTVEEKEELLSLEKEEESPHLYRKTLVKLIDYKEQLIGE